MEHDPDRRMTDPDAAQHDRSQALSHHADPADHGAASRRAHWPKDDQRSSSRLARADGHLTAEERDASWPLG